MGHTLGRISLKVQIPHYVFDPSGVCLTPVYDPSGVAVAHVCITGVGLSPHSV